MATTLTITPADSTTLVISGTSTEFNISGDSTTLTMNTASGKMSSTNMQNAIDELAGEHFKGTSEPTGSQLDEGDLWYDTDDDELKVYRGTQWQTLAAAGGDVETMLQLDGGSF